MNIDIDVKIEEHLCAAVSVARLRFIQLTIQQLVGILLLIVPGPGGRVRPRLHLMVDNIRQIYSHKIHIFAQINIYDHR